MVALALLCGCAHNPRPLPAGASAGPIDEAAAVSIAKQLVNQREKWKRVDYEARRIDAGWKVSVCPKPIKITGPVVFMTLDESGRLTSYERVYNLE